MQLRKFSGVRDRVYAVLSLVDAEALEKFSVVVDYDLTPAALHTALLHRHRKQLEQKPQGLVDTAGFSALIPEVLDLPLSHEVARQPVRGPTLRITPDEIVTYSARRYLQSINLYHTCHCRNPGVVLQQLVFDGTMAVFEKQADTGHSGSMGDWPKGRVKKSKDYRMTFRYTFESVKSTCR